MGINKLLFRLAIQRIVTHIAPDRIPLSRPRVFERHYFSATLTGIDGLPEVLVDGLGADEIRARAWNNDASAYIDPVTIPISQAVHAEIDVIYYLRQYEFKSKSASKFLLATWFGVYRLCAWWGDFSQGLFNRRTIEWRQRMQVLQDLMAWSIEHPRNFTSASQLLAMRYGDRVVFHPSYRSQVDYIEFLLQSLAADHLASQAPDQHRYRIDPRGFTAIDAFNTEERRHKDSGRVQKILAFIGLLALIASFVQAAAGIKQAWFPDPGSVGESTKSCAPTSGTPAVNQRSHLG